MPRSRILIVDDSVTARRAVTDMLSTDADLEVIATASNGRLALEKFDLLRPDLIILDLEMPDVDGLAMLSALRQKGERVPVLIFSQFTQRGAAATLDALSRGADDYVAKPDPQAPGGLAVARSQMVEKVRALLKLGQSTLRVPSRLAGRSVIRSRVEAVVIAVSTGGPNALAEMLPAMPAWLPVPMFIVQHMLPQFSRFLTQRLSAACRLPVKEAAEGETVMAGQVYIAPGERHLELRRSGNEVRVALTAGPPENSCRPAADVLFRSAVDAYGSGTLGVVLTGMGQDGLRGCERVREAGGAVLVQDEATSIVWGMPGAVARAGLASATLPLEQIALEIEQRARYGRSPSTLIG